MNQTPKKRTSSSYSVTKVITEKSNKNENSPKKPFKKNRKLWTSVDLAKHMEPSVEELRYRKKKREETNVVAKYSRHFKCTKCDFRFKPLTKTADDLAIHSCLQVLFCKDCLNFYEDGEFSVDSEGEEKYCRWCGEGGLIYSCSNCLSGFCTSCIKKHLGAKYNSQVNRSSNWECFLCFSKPLWFMRFICSLAVDELKRLKENQLLESNEEVEKTDKENEKDNESQVSLVLDENAVKSQDSGSSTCCSIISNPTPELSITKLPEKSASKTGLKRKRIVYSSSDESEEYERVKNMKKIKPEESPEKKSPSTSKNFMSPEIFEKLEKILRLAEYQMAFGVSWSTKMLSKLYQPNFASTPEDLKTECQKIKWFFSVLSTYLVESCSSVDLIEKSIVNEQKLIPSPEKTHQGDYSTVVKFLDFITNQVKVFLEKGINLQDVLEGEIYHENQIIGIKVKSKASPSTSEHQTLTPKSKTKCYDSTITDAKNSGEKTSEDESILPSLEADGRESSETDDGTSKKALNVSDQYPDYLEDAEDQKMKIQEILSILENA